MSSVGRPPWPQRASDLLFGPETSARLFVVQAGIVALMAGRIALSSYPDLTPQPPGLWRPVPFLRFLDAMPSLGPIIAFQVVGVVAAVAWFVVGRNPRWRANGRRVTFVVVFMCLVVLAGFRASRGKILHNDVLIIFAALPLLFAPGDAGYRNRVASRRTGWPIRTAIVIVALAYFFTGLWKLRNTGIDWVFSDNMRWSLYWSWWRNDPPWPDLVLFVANRPWLSELSAGFILLLELLFPIVVFVRRSRPVFIVGAWIFHAGTYFMLGLDYWMYAAVVTILLVDWPPLLDRIGAWATRERSSRADPPVPPEPALHDDARGALRT